MNEPSYNENGKLFLPNLSGLGLSAKKLKAMNDEPVNFDTYFCLTGVFAFGERPDVEKEIELAGGRIASTVRKTGCTLVIGTAASNGWSGEVWGRKIEDAIEYIKQGLPVKIITEDRLTEALLTAPKITEETYSCKMARYKELLKKGYLTDKEVRLLQNNARKENQNKL